MSVLSRGELRMGWLEVSVDCAGTLVFKKMIREQLQKKQKLVV